MAQREAVQVFAKEVFDVIEKFIDDVPDRDQIVQILTEAFQAFQAAGGVIGIENRPAFYVNLAELLLSQATARVPELKLD